MAPKTLNVIPWAKKISNYFTTFGQKQDMDEKTTLKFGRKEFRL